MTVISYNKELEIANLQFRRLFSNITIYRNKQKIKFHVVNENRTRIFKNLENPTKNETYSLPIISILRTGITKNDDRISNINNEIKYRQSSKMPIDYNLLAPVPIDISYSVTIMSKYQSDIDMCMSNFIPFFNKDLFVRCEHPKFEDIEYTSQVIMDGTITEEHPPDLESTQDDIVTATCTFIFKTYIFGGSAKAKSKKIIRDGVTYDGDEPTQVISTYISSYYDENLSTDISTEISVIVDTEYDGFIPLMKSINVGFYPVPILSQYIPHVNWVDSLCARGFDETPWVDRVVWKIDETTGELTQEHTDWVPPKHPELSAYMD